MMSKLKAVGSKAEDFESVRSKVVLMFFNADFLSEENNVYKPFEDDQRNKMGDTRSYNLLECQYLSYKCGQYRWFNLETRPRGNLY